MAGTIDIVAAVIRDEAGRILLVRKRGTTAFMQPGGKRDPVEDDIATLAREIDEELGCQLVPDSIRPLGEFDAISANEPGWRVHASLYEIAVNYGGGPVGVETLAAALSEPRDAIEDIIEPFLIQCGYLQRTPRGRLLTSHAFKHLGLAEPARDPAQFGLFGQSEE